MENKDINMLVLAHTNLLLRSNLEKGEHNVFVLKSNSNTVGLNVHMLEQ
jgi:hypothetical protein